MDADYLTNQKSSHLFRQRFAERGVAEINPAVTIEVCHRRILNKFCQLTKLTAYYISIL
jgi:hypothetical protein